jgi:hypothetical protein
MRRRRITKNNRPASHSVGNKRRRQTRASRGLPIGITLYYYPKAKKMAPALYDPALQRAVRRGLIKARTILGPRGSDWVIGCVLLNVRQREGFWLDEDHGDLRKNQGSARKTK